LKLRRATTADASRLALIGPATFLESFANDHDIDQVLQWIDDTHSRAWWGETLGDPDKPVWLVEEAEGCPVGYAMAQPSTLPFADGPDDYELKRIYMLSKWHGGGWGAKLYQVVEDEARARGAKRLVLSVYIVNFAAQAFYKKRGFEEIGRWIFEGFDASEDFIYAKNL
jgi:diamine N-acetyltransferase